MVKTVFHYFRANSARSSYNGNFILLLRNVVEIKQRSQCLTHVDNLIWNPRHFWKPQEFHQLGLDISKNIYIVEALMTDDTLAEPTRME